METKSIIEFLRGSVVGQDPNILYDPEFNPSDESLKEILEYALVFVDPTATIEDIHQKQIYPLILYSKKELYSRLATKSAPYYKVSTPELELDKGDRFDHYYKLIKLVDNEITVFNNSGGSFSIEAHEVLLGSRYYTQRNYDLSKAPYIKMAVDNLYTDSVEVSWKYENTKFFLNYKVYIMEVLPNINNNIIDIYNKNNINNKATKLEVLYDIHSQHFRFTNLKPNTKYKLCVTINEKNGLQGFSEIEVQTLDDNVDSEVTPNA